MAVTIQTRRDDSTDWSTANPVLALGEIGIETDTDKAKYGDGFTAWNDLPYWIDEGAQIPDGTVQGQTLRYNLTDDGWEATSDLIVADTGNVGIGTSNPTALLKVGDGTSTIRDSTVVQIIENAVGGTTLQLSCDATSKAGFYMGNPASSTQRGVGRITYDMSNEAMEFWTNAAERMRLDASGNLLVGKTASSTAVEGIELRAGGVCTMTRDSNAALLIRRNGTDGVIQQWYNDATNVANILGDGSYQGPISTAAVKENIADSDIGLSEIMQIPVRKFDYTNGMGRRDAGFIAEELAEVVPQAVSENMGRVDAHLIPVLVKAIQELTARVEALENG